MQKHIHYILLMVDEGDFCAGGAQDSEAGVAIVDAEEAVVLFVAIGGEGLYCA